MIKKIFRKRGKLQKLELEIEQARLEQLRIKAKNERIDKLSKELKDHLKENNFGQRLYLQMLANGR